MGKKKLLQSGNFIVTRESGNGYNWIAIKAVSGIWTLRFREDNPMYTRLQMILADKELIQYLDSWIKIMFCYTNITPDLDLLNVMYESYNAYMDRQKAVYVTDPEEDEETILRKMRMAYEMEQEPTEED